MTTIYVVTDGEYSDYHIVGVYSTLENAERMKKETGSSDIEEYELDEFVAQLREGLQPYSVTMERDGYATARESSPTGTIDLFLSWYGYMENGRRMRKSVLTGKVWATSVQHAVKIANERRVFLIASNEWQGDEELFVRPACPAKISLVQPVRVLECSLHEGHKGAHIAGDGPIPVVWEGN
jgi:hypothetical protein